MPPDGRLWVCRGRERESKRLLFGTTNPKRVVEYLPNNFLSGLINGVRYCSISPVTARNHDNAEIKENSGIRE
jgi:hypothetical protein